MLVGVAKCLCGGDRPSTAGGRDGAGVHLPAFWMTPFRPVSSGEPISSEHFHRAVNVNDEDLLVRILQGG